VSRDSAEPRQECASRFGFALTTTYVNWCITRLAPPLCPSRQAVRGVGPHKGVAPESWVPPPQRCYESA
jgi:hypothetical protein